MESVGELQLAFEKHAIAWGKALKLGDHQAANKENIAVNKLAKRIAKDDKLRESILISLLTSDQPAVRLLAAVHALHLGLQIKQSEDTLVKIAHDPSIPVIRLMAQINLDQWSKKKS